MYIATKTMDSRMALFGPNGAAKDKLKICKVATDLKDAIWEDVHITGGDRIKKGELIPAIEKSLVERGVLVKESDVGDSKETMADVKGDRSMEANTDVSIGNPAGSKKGNKLSDVAERA